MRTYQPSTLGMRIHASYVCFIDLGAVSQLRRLDPAAQVESRPTSGYTLSQQSHQEWHTYLMNRGSWVWWSRFLWRPQLNSDDELRPTSISTTTQTAKSKWLPSAMDSLFWSAYCSVSPWRWSCPATTSAACYWWKKPFPSRRPISSPTCFLSPIEIMPMTSCATTSMPASSSTTRVSTWPASTRQRIVPNPTKLNFGQALLPFPKQIG